METKLLANLCTEELALFLEKNTGDHKLTVIGVKPDKVLIKYAGEWEKDKASSEVKDHFREYLSPGLIISVIS